MEVLLMCWALAGRGRAMQGRATQGRAGKGGDGTWSDSCTTRSRGDCACILAPSPEAARTVTMSTPQLKSSAPAHSC